LPIFRAALGGLAPRKKIGDILGRREAEAAAATRE